MVHWLGLGAFTAVGLGSIPGQGTKILQATQLGQKKKEASIELCWCPVWFDGSPLCLLHIFSIPQSYPFTYRIVIFCVFLELSCWIGN